MSNAILIMSDNNFLTMNLSHQNRVLSHWIIQLSAIILITIASICIFINKNNQMKSHFQTTHSIFGLITNILTLLSGLGGVFTKYSFQLRNVVKPALAKCCHSFAGMVSYVLAIITIILGFNQMWHEESDVNYKKPILIALIVICAFYVLIKSFILFITRLKDFLSR
jgi:cytochrome b-561 domain-containing protein 2